MCKNMYPPLNINTFFPRYGDSHVKDKMVARPSYIFNMEIPIMVRKYLYIEIFPNENKIAHTDKNIREKMRPE